MKSLHIVQTLFKIGKILSNIAFIFSVVGFCGCIVGLFSLGIGNGDFIRLGGVTLHGLIPEEYGYNIKSIAATLSGAKELMRLGILTLVIPTGCALVGNIVRRIIAGFMKIEEATAMDLYFGNAASIALGAMFIIVSLLCRYGAELVCHDQA